MIKRKIIIFTNYYLPGYKAGGPIRSVSNIVEALGDFFDFYIVTTDRDSFEKVPFKNIYPNEWNKIGKANVFYISPDNLRFNYVLNLLKKDSFDLIYLNSYFNLVFSIYPLLAVKFFNASKADIILAPRGEFSEGALQLKARKKSLFMKLSKFLRLHKNIEWQASSKFEKEEILHIMGGLVKNITIAPNIPVQKKRETNIKRSSNKEVLKVIFLSRVSEKKNLDFALNILSKYVMPLEFNIFGVVDDFPYWEKCKSIIKTLPSNIKVIYHGVVSHDEVSDHLINNDIFFLPTKGENYGHAIVESFLVGTPVLISDTTPWKNLSKAGVGWDIPLNNEKEFLEVLKDYHLRIMNGQSISRNYISNWIFRELDVENVIKLNRELFI